MTPGDIAKLKRRLKRGPRLSRAERAKYLLELLRQFGKKAPPTETREGGSKC